MYGAVILIWKYYLCWLIIYIYIYIIYLNGNIYIPYLNGSYTQQDAEIQVSLLLDLFSDIVHTLQLYTES
jgi:hypothetical protein